MDRRGSCDDDGAFMILRWRYRKDDGAMTNMRWWWCDNDNAMTMMRWYNAMTMVRWWWRGRGGGNCAIELTMNQYGTITKENWMIPQGYVGDDAITGWKLSDGAVVNYTVVCIFWKYLLSVTCLKIITLYTCIHV